ncbi:MAG TPA: orotidine-5'-phosphate decarboxylase [Terriglobales bacterium]|nr:orotidine-5'-phosphate decarboxylase [Terriglobales bacterium]
MTDPRERLIVALDVPSAAAAQKMVAAVGDSASIYKVGMQLYTAEGPQVVRDLIASGRKVFLDLKFHDIPNTVGSAIREAAGLGVHMLTVHGSGGSKMLRAAADAAKLTPSSAPIVLAVTVLTSMDQNDLNAVGVAGEVGDQVVRLARVAIQSGCGGVVASVQEAALLRKELGGNFAIVTPGIRPGGSAVGDQARVATPAEAMAAGATHIVVGRPITGASDPGKSARDVIAEMNSSVSAMRS